MQRIRRAIASARVTFALVATCGLLLQAVSGGAALQLLLAQGGVDGAITCAADGSRQNLPASPHPAHECSCCIIACASSGCGIPASAPAELLRRFGETIAWVPAHRHELNFSPVVHFTARGPPRA
jgi:hypothetical protein